MMVRPLGDFGLVMHGMKVEKVLCVGDVMWGEDATCCRDTLNNWWSFLKVRGSGTVGVPNPRPAFWSIITADTITEPQGTTQVRRAQQDDQLTFAVWMIHSKSSTFYTRSHTWSNGAKSWQNVLLLWPQKSVLDSYFQATHISQADYWPFGLLGNREEQLRRIKELLLSLDDALLTEAKFFDSEGIWRENAPWRDLLVKVREQLTNRYGEHVDLRVQKRMKLIPMIDNSFMAATLSRRLIASNNYIGLGPADARVGDELYFLAGGKTPFVLRPSTRVPAKFEIVGDCYIVGLMDGDAAQTEGRWEPIYLV